MLKFIVTVALVGFASAATIDYASTGGGSGSGYSSGGGSGGGGSDGYGAQPQPGYGGGAQPQPGYGGGNVEKKCQTYYDTITSEHCEPYTERECRTMQKETCVDVTDKKCRAFVSSKQASVKYTILWRIFS